MNKIALMTNNREETLRIKKQLASDLNYSGYNVVDHDIGSSDTAYLYVMHNGYKWEIRVSSHRNDNRQESHIYIYDLNSDRSYKNILSAIMDSIDALPMDPNSRDFKKDPIEASLEASLIF